MGQNVRSRQIEIEMIPAELRAKIHELMAAGILPKDPPVIHRASLGAVGAPRQDVCSICSAPEPTVS